MFKLLVFIISTSIVIPAEEGLKSIDSKIKNHYVVDRLKAIVSGKEISSRELQAPGKRISRPIVKRQVYFKDVAPIIKKKCTSCHNPEGTGLMNFISYEDIAGRGAMFKHVIEKDLMPPWYVDPNTGPFRGDISLTLEEKALLLRWAELGFPVRKRGKRTFKKELMLFLRGIRKHKHELSPLITDNFHVLKT